MNLRQHTNAVKQRQALVVRPSVPYVHVARSAATSDTRYAEDEAGRLHASLAKAGAEILGCGAYSVVVGMGDHAVLKVSVGLHDGYHKYIPWVLERNRLKDIDPGFLRHLPVIHRTHVLPNGVRLTVMERLQGDCYALGTLPPSFMDLLRTAAESAGHVFDMHHGNAMARDDGTPVATDPWAAPTLGSVYQPVLLRRLQ